MTKGEQIRLYAEIADRIREGDDLVFELFVMMVMMCMIDTSDALDIMRQALRLPEWPVLIHMKEEKNDRD